MSRLDIDALRALCAVAEHGGVTRAAAVLMLTQPAVSHKIRRLEGSIGCTLLARRPGNPLFTGEGERLLGYARRILALHDEALLSLEQKPLRGRISLGMSEDASCSQLSGVLGRFTRLYPNISVHTRVGQSQALAQAIDDGACDLAVLQLFHHQLRPGDEIVTTDSLHWVRSVDWLPDFTRALPFLSFDEQCLYRQWAMASADPRTPPLVPVLECSSSAGVVNAVREGLGVALLSARHLSEDMAILDDQFGSPPPVASVVRQARRGYSEAVDALARSFCRETTPVKDSDVAFADFSPGPDVSC